MEQNIDPEQYQYISYFKPEDLILSEEDLKFEDNTKPPMKRKKMNRNYDFLFSENASIKVEKLLQKYRSQIISTKGRGIKPFVTYLRLRFIEKVKKIYTQEEEIWEYIHYLTSNVDIDKHQKILEVLQMIDIVDEVKENNGIICIRTTFGEIKFSRISNFFPNLEFDDEIEDINQRLGKIDDEGDCHNQAIEYSKRLKAIGIDNNVVTAVRYIKTDRSGHLHSWDEFQIDGKEHVLDYSQNVVMNKEGYYALNHIRKVVSKINCVDIEKDKIILNELNDGKYYMDPKTYLTCRDEIMRDLQKNIEIFDEER